MKNGKFQIVITRKMLDVDIEYIKKGVRQAVGDSFDIVTPYTYDEAGIITVADNADVYLGSFVTSETIKAAPHLKLIQVPWTGMDTFDFKAVQGTTIPICNTHSNAAAVAELGLSLLLDLLKKVSYHDRKMRGGNWNRDQIPLDLKSRMLSQQTVCILGFGNIGGRIGKMVASFGAKVIAVDARAVDGLIDGRDEIDKAYSPSEWLNAVAKGDIVICTLPLTDITRNQINSDTISAFKPDTILINISRAEIMNEETIYAALKDGRLAGFAADIWWNAPKRGESICWPSSHEDIITFDNVIFSPHRAGFIEEALLHLDGAIENLIRLIKDEDFLSRVDTVKQY